MKVGGARSASEVSKWLPLLGALGLAACLIAVASSAWAEEEAPPEVFSASCVRCHAEDAQGDGPMHTQFLPPPANLPLTRNTEIMYRSILENGVPGTAMPAFALSKSNAATVIDYIKTRPFRTDRQWGNPWTMSPVNVSLEMGQTIYLTACAGCHGETGDGQSAWGSDPHVWPKPANFQARNSESGRLYYITAHGSPGTMMAPQSDKFPEMALWTMAKYVESLYRPGSTAGMRTPEKQLPPYKNPISPGDQKALAKLMVSFAALPERDRWSVITFIRHRGGLPEPLIELGRGGGQASVPSGDRQ